MSELLEVKNLSVYFQNRSSGQNEESEVNAQFMAVNDVSLTLHRGEVLGIVGESGSGKSVTALSILGLLSYPKAFHSPESSIKLNGCELIGAQNKMIRDIRGGKIGFVFQEPMSSLNPLHKIGDQIAETLIIHQKISTKKAHAKTLELLKTVGIKNPQTRYKSFPFELSGGQRQRVMIAMAIANNPQILIADEPTTALDVTIQEQIINLLLELKTKLQMSIIFISHDLNLVKKIANQIIVMYQGKIVENKSTKKIFENPEHPYTKKLIASTLSLKNINNISNEVVAKITHLKVAYALKKSFWGKITAKIKAVDDISFQLYKGETLGIVGESGSGKSTLGMCLAKLIKYKGDIEVCGVGNDRDFRRKVQIVFQDPYNSLNPRLNISQIIGEGLKIHYPGLKANEYQAKIAEILEETGLSVKDQFKYPHEFSGGQRQRIAIARALIIKPEIIVLDEPTSALDVTVQSQIIDLLKNIQKKYTVTYVFISHDMRAVQSMADRIAVMKDGKIVEIDKADKIFKQPEKEYTRQLIKASLLVNE